MSQKIAEINLQCFPGRIFSCQGLLNSRPPTLVANIQEARQQNRTPSNWTSPDYTFRWELKIGADSKEMLACKGWTDFNGLDLEWSVQSVMNMLGHTLSNDSSCARCFVETIGSMTRCFHANVRLGLRTCTAWKKIHFLNTCVVAIARFRWARWPWQKFYGQQLDKFQLQFLAVLFNIAAHEHETYEVFRVRRHAESHQLACNMGLWSVEWARRVVSWSKHAQ